MKKRMALLLAAVMLWAVAYSAWAEIEQVTVPSEMLEDPDNDCVLACSADESKFLITNRKTGGLYLRNAQDGSVSPLVFVREADRKYIEDYRERLLFSLDLYVKMNRKDREKKLNEAIERYVGIYGTETISTWDQLVDFRGGSFAGYVQCEAVKGHSAVIFYNDIYAAVNLETGSVFLLTSTHGDERLFQIGQRSFSVGVCSESNRQAILLDLETGTEETVALPNEEDYRVRQVDINAQGNISMILTKNYIIDPDTKRMYFDQEIVIKTALGQENRIALDQGAIEYWKILCTDTHTLIYDSAGSPIPALLIRQGEEGWRELPQDWYPVDAIGNEFLLYDTMWEQYSLWDPATGDTREAGSSASNLDPLLTERFSSVLGNGQGLLFVPHEGVQYYWKLQ